MKITSRIKCTILFILVAFAANSHGQTFETNIQGLVIKNYSCKFNFKGGVYKIINGLLVGRLENYATI